MLRKCHEGPGSSRSSAIGSRWTSVSSGTSASRSARTARPSCDVARRYKIHQMSLPGVEPGPKGCKCKDGHRSRRVLDPYPSECLCLSIPGLLASQVQGQPSHSGIMADHQQGTDVRWRPAREIEQVCCGSVIDPFLQEGLRISAKLLLGELPRLAGAPGGRAQHPVGHVVGLSQPAASNWRITTPPGRQRPVVIGDIVGPGRLRVPQQDQVSHRSARHGLSLSEHCPHVPAGLAYRRTPQDLSSSADGLSCWLAAVDDYGGASA
jgi:hypothetical protein